MKMRKIATKNIKSHFVIGVKTFDMMIINRSCSRHHNSKHQQQQHITINIIFMTMNAPWQLYIFCAVQLVGSFAMYGIVFDPCQLLSGKATCKSGAETYTARAMAIGFLYVGVFFLTLTFNNRTNAPKLKRLASMALNSAVAMLVGVMFTGSQRMGGVERHVFHLLDMIFMLLLLVVLMTAVMTDSEMEGIKTPFSNLGVNPKSFVLLVLVSVSLKLLVLNDFVSPSSFLVESDSETHLSRTLWTWLSVCILEILFALWFALAYGDEQDYESITIATALMMIVSVLSVIPISNELVNGMMRATYIGVGVALAVAIVALVGGRRSNRQQQGYQTVSGVV